MTETTISQATIETQRFTVRDFAPVWGATVMGTAVVSSIFAALAHEGMLSQVTEPLAHVILAIALVIATFVLGTTAVRWVKYPQAALADLRHPVKGAMSATFGGAFLTLAVAIGRSGEALVGADITRALVLALTAIGGSLALIFGVAFLSGIFAQGNTPQPMITGAWFIPPVVTIVIPTALAPMLTEASPLNRELLWVSWLALGMGAMLYLAITAVLIGRSATNALPPAPLAPSLLIGMGPAGLIGANLVLLSEASVRVGVAGAEVLPNATLMGLAVWGFGLWWAIAGLVVLIRGYQRLPFTLASWGFTFPLGAWVVAGIILAARLESGLIMTLALVGAAVLIVLWVVLVWLTAKGIRRSTIWAH